MTTLQIYSILIASGLAVGFLNTLAAGATVISMTVFMALGIPIVEASGTNRIAVLLQNLTSTFTFKKQHLLDPKTSFKIAIPIVIGILIGAQFSMMVSETFFKGCFSAGLAIMIALMVLKPSSWLKESDSGVTPLNTKSFIMLVLSGFYGGSIYVGVGYFFIAVFVLSMGYDLIRANALKSFIAFVTTPFSLVIFMLNDQVNYEYGLIHAIGNIIGAYIAAKYATKLGVKFIRLLLILVIILSLLVTFDIIGVKS
ncbi:MAG: sulfite exporter TauE/SafE family protein [Rikenellaceae bacterium]